MEKHFELWTRVPPELMRGKPYRICISLDKNSLNELLDHFNHSLAEGDRVTLKVRSDVVYPPTRTCINEYQYDAV